VNNTNDDIDEIFESIENTIDHPDEQTPPNETPPPQTETLPQTTHITKETIDLLLIDLFELSKDIEEAITALRQISTTDQLKEIEYTLKWNGVSATKDLLQIYFHDAKQHATNAVITLFSIKQVMNRLSEKLRYLEQNIED
jgi:hypothetical protein